MNIPPAQAVGPVYIFSAAFCKRKLSKYGEKVVLVYKIIVNLGLITII